MQTEQSTAMAWRLADPPNRKEVRQMRITLHFGRYTVTIIVKRNNRHSAQ